jgi:hypothetical protein
MASFSWSDSLRACTALFIRCCGANVDPAADEDSGGRPPGPHRIHRARTDELQSLLADTDAHAETLSLHCDVGAGDSRRNPRRHVRLTGAAKRITLFGFHLFGRPPPIQLPPDDDHYENFNNNGAPVGRQAIRVDRPSRTLDADASPLDPALISNLARQPQPQPNADALLAAARAPSLASTEREERRAKRQQRRALKRGAAALALAHQHSDGIVNDDAFEGFQGSGGGGSGYPHIPRPFRAQPPSSSSSGTTTTTTRTEEFGPFKAASAASEQEAGEDDDGADLGGELYAARQRGHARSDSRSRSTTSSAAALRTRPGAPSGPPHPQEARHAEKEGMGLRSLFSTVTVAGAQAFEGSPADHEGRASPAPRVQFPREAFPITRFAARP